MGHAVRRGGGCDQDTGLVVSGIPVYPSGAFDVFDAGVSRQGERWCCPRAFSTSGHQAWTACHSRQVPSMSATSTFLKPSECPATGFSLSQSLGMAQLERGF
jgi:hypothetical protein